MCTYCVVGTVRVESTRSRYDLHTAFAGYLTRPRAPRAALAVVSDVSQSTQTEVCKKESTLACLELRRTSIEQRLEMSVRLHV